MDKEGNQMAEEKSSPEESKTKPQSPEEAKQETKDDAPPKKKKINRMTLAKVEEQLKHVQETQGGLDSLYAKHLLQRKAYLLQNQQSSKK